MKKDFQKPEVSVYTITSENVMFISSVFEYTNSKFANTGVGIVDRGTGFEE